MPSRLDALRARRVVPGEPLPYLIKEAYERIEEDSEAIRYAVGTMTPVQKQYTDKTYSEAERVRSQLAKGYGPQISAAFEYQGSVTNNTHVRGKSDIDLLCIRSEFETLEPPQQAAAPYSGDPLVDMRQIRTRTIEVLRKEFPAATVSPGGKSIKIEGGSLARTIDCVPSNWYNTVAWTATGDKKERGVQVFDAENSLRLKNLPFLHNSRVLDKDRSTQGGMCKAARLLKSLIYDADKKIDVSSYDATSIAYGIESYRLIPQGGNDLLIVFAARNYIRSLCQNTHERDRLEVPNRTRKVFCPEGASYSGLLSLRAIIDILCAEIETDLLRSYRAIGTYVTNMRQW